MSYYEDDDRYYRQQQQQQRQHPRSQPMREQRSDSYHNQSYASHDSNSQYYQQQQQQHSYYSDYPSDSQQNHHHDHYSRGSNTNSENYYDQRPNMPAGLRQRQNSSASSTAPLVSDRQMHHGNSGGPYAHHGHYRESDADLDDYIYRPDPPRYHEEEYRDRQGSREHSGYSNPRKMAAAGAGGAGMGAAAYAANNMSSSYSAPTEKGRLPDAIPTESSNVVSLDLPAGVKPSQTVIPVSLPQSQYSQSYQNSRVSSYAQGMPGDDYPRPPNLANSDSYHNKSVPKEEAVILPAGGPQVYQYANSYPGNQAQQYAAPAHPPLASSYSGGGDPVKRHKSVSDRYNSNKSGGECGCGECCSSFFGGCCTCCGHCACRCCGCLCCPFIIILILACIGVGLALYFLRDKIFHKT